MKTYLNNLRWGKFNLIAGDMISEIAAYCGEWCDVEVVLLLDVLSVNDNIIEVGANIGLHSVPLAKAIPNGKLLCFEPQRIIFQQLCCNLALNDLTNVETYRIGVGEKNEKIWVETCDYNERWNYGVFSLDKGFSTENPFSGKVEQDEIDVVALDQFAPARRLPSLALLKIDAEGFDLQVLHGARELIAQHQPYIFIEIQLDTIDSTLAEIEKLGYQAFWVLSQRYQPDNFNHAPECDFGADGNFLCIAQDKLADPNSRESQIARALQRVTSAEQLERSEVEYLVKLGK